MTDVTECCICYDDTISTIRCITPCNHSLCFNCMTKYLSLKSECHCSRTVFTNVIQVKNAITTPIPDLIRDNLALSVSIQMSPLIISNVKIRIARPTQLVNSSRFYYMGTYYNEPQNERRSRETYYSPSSVDNNCTDYRQEIYYFASLINHHQTLYTLYRCYTATLFSLGIITNDVHISNVDSGFQYYISDDRKKEYTRNRLICDVEQEDTITLMNRGDSHPIIIFGFEVQAL